MGTNEKPPKDAPISLRTTMDLKLFMEEEAARMNMPLTQLVETILIQYKQGRSSHGSRMVWPPEFSHFQTDPVRSKPAD